MVKARRKKRKLFSWKFFFFLGIFLTVIPTIVGFGWYTYTLRMHNDSTLGDEILEQTQNTIPSDLLAQIKKENQVLGATSKSSPKPVSVHIPILMYHYVEYVKDPGDKMRISLDTTPYTLEQEIITLQHAGYTFMTNAELANVLDGEAKLPSKPIVLTFDDSYQDFYDDAYPVLQKYHAKATQYVIAGGIYMNHQNHMNTREIQKIANDGLVEIGAHTVNHLWLKGLDKATVTVEVLQSKQILEQMIGKPVVSFAYPYGAFDQQAVDIVKAAGFTSAVSTIPGIDQPQSNRYFLYRLRPGGRTGDNLLTWLATVKNAN